MIVFKNYEKLDVSGKPYKLSFEIFYDKDGKQNKIVEYVSGISTHFIYKETYTSTGISVYRKRVNQN